MIRLEYDRVSSVEYELKGEKWEMNYEKKVS